MLHGVAMRSLVAFDLLLVAAVLAPLVACAPPEDAESAQGNDAISSAHAAILELEMEGEVVARAAEPPRQAILTQLQYLSGHLSANGGAGAQTGLAEVLEAVETPSGETKTVRYRVAVPVAWPKWSEAPASYELALPRDVTRLADFNRTYDGTCGKSKYGQDRYWYDYDPRAPGCTLADADVVRMRAAVRPNPRETENRLPEYDLVWKDDRLDILLVNGVIGSDMPSDESYREVESILTGLSGQLRDVARGEEPATSTIRKHQVLTGKIDVGGRAREVSVRALNLYEVESSGPDFDAVYGPASAKADLIVYSGHSGLGRHIRSLQQRTLVEAGRYQILYFYGCNTLEYIGTDLLARKSAANGREVDPLGTKFLDIVSTARPAYGDDGLSTLAIANALLRRDRSWREILGTFSSTHLTVVSGEEDNPSR
jgi:hypothetical protein